MTCNRRPSALTSLATALTAVLLLPGCGGGEPRGADAGSRVAEPSPSESSESSESSVRDEPRTDYPGPPATGERVRMHTIGLRIPEGWVGDPVEDPEVQVASVVDGVETIAVSDYPYPLTGLETPTLRERARTEIRNAGFDRAPQILPSVLLDGTDFYHFAGRTDDVTYVEAVGTLTRGRALVVLFKFLPSTPVRERTAVVESVLASVELD